MRLPALPLVAMVCLLLPAPSASGQAANFEDGFEDGEFTSNPAWSGHDERFVISPFAHGHLLQLDSPDTEDAWLSTPSTAVTGYWEFFVMLDDFLPSGSNRAEVFLMSDREELADEVSGYAVQVGQAGDDYFRLVRYDAGEATDLLADTTRITGTAEGYRLRVERSAGGTWSLRVARGYLGEPVDAGATVTDLTHDSSTHFGVRVRYTSTRADRFFFDFKIDRPPFRWTGLRVAQEGLRLAFSREVDLASAEPGNFKLNPDPGVAPVLSLPAPDTLLLDYGTLPSAAYELSLEGVADLEGEPVEPDTMNFMVFGEAAPGELLFNEFAFDPPGDAPEYVEIVNTGPSILNLQGWRVGDAAGSAALAADTLALFPDSLLVLTADTAALAGAYAQRGPSAPVPSMPTLNNGGDLLLLLAPGGWTADSLAYTPAWGGADGALERRSLAVDAAWPENWADAPGNPGGSPGLSNTVAPDTEAPRVRSLRFAGEGTFELVFSERLDAASAGDPARYDVTGGVAVQEATFFPPDTVRVDFTPALANNTTYTFSAEGVEDLFGNFSVSWDTSFTWQVLSTADAGELLITEFAYDPPPGWSEYVEIYNPGDKSFSADELYLEDAGGAPVPLSPAPLVIPPGSRWLLLPESSLADSLDGVSVLVMGSAFPALNNGGDRLVLRNEHGVAVDSLAYLPSWGGQERSLERRSLAHPAWERPNWADSPPPFPGSPGTDNRIGPDMSPPRLAEFRITGPGSLLLRFDEQPEAGPAGNASNYRLEGGGAAGGGVTDARFAHPDSVVLTLTGDLRHGQSYRLSWEGIADYFGNTAPGDTSFAYVDYPAAETGDLLVTEFMYDPPDGWSEYVELLNRSPRTVDLHGVTLQDGGNHSHLLADTTRLLAPGDYLVLAPESSLRETFPEIDLLVPSGGIPVLNNGGDRILLRTAGGVAADSLRYDPSWGGRQKALERRAISRPAAAAYNWSEPPDGSAGTPGRANLSRPDATAPDLVELVVAGPNRLELLFSEAVDSARIRPGNFRLQPRVPVSAVLFSGPDALVLELGGALRHRQRYTLTFDGVSDAWGNAGAGNASFTYLDYPGPGSGELLITEFMYDPPPGWTEFVEVYNAGGEELSLRKITLSDAGVRRAPLTDSLVLLAPGAYLVLAPDATLRDSFPEIALLEMGSRFPALNNGGDRIAIGDSLGRVLEELTYSGDWSGEEHALERRSLQHPASLPENWVPSPAGRGSPGEANRALPDRDPPELLALAIPDGRTFSLLFSERLREIPGWAGRFIISPSVTLAAMELHGDSLVLRSAVPLNSGTTYTVAAQGLEDAFGNAMVPQSLSARYLRIDAAEPGDLVINEILFREEAGAHEFVEVLNTSTKNLDLQNWRLGDAVSSTLLREAVLLLPGELLVFTGTGSSSRFLQVPGFPSLNNSSDRIYLRDADGVTVDSLAYVAESHPVRAGHSLERRDPRAPTLDPSNWTESSAEGGASAGHTNSAFRPDVEPPRLRFAGVSREGMLEVRFGEFVRLLPETEFSAGKLPLRLYAFQPHQADRLLLEPEHGGILEPDASLSILAVRNLEDHRGNRMDLQEIDIAWPPGPGDLTFNEILYEPIAGADDGRPDQAEYVELVNRRAYPLSLEGLHLHGAADENGRVARLVPAEDRHRSLEGGGFALLYADTAADLRRSRVGVYFRLEEETAAPAPPLLRFDRDGLGLAPDRPLFLADSSGTVIDSLFYTASWHNPDLVDVRGIALEKIDPSLSGNAPLNWGSSAAPLGGSPLQENSIRSREGESLAQTGLHVSPNPFSPDGDGYQDHLVISWVLDRPDYLLRVRIYDRFGRPVHTLADGMRAGPSGSLLWDGRDGQRRSNRIGIYIVTLEAWSNAAGRRQAYRELAVLARKLR
ncbi:MAG: lamin tail domain-containing protein [Balneolaceae bacterium]|nr:lamin tail domain-containing protein [Balneolaceae bacterium]